MVTGITVSRSPAGGWRLGGAGLGGGCWRGCCGLHGVNTAAAGARLSLGRADTALTLARVPLLRALTSGAALQIHTEHTNISIQPDLIF